MGIYMDTIEDSAERFGQFKDQIGSSRLKSSFKFLPETTPSFIECPLCGERLLTEDNLNQHIHSRHANKHAYIRADGKIIRNFEIFEKAPKSLKAIVLGVDKAKLIVEQAGYEKKELEFIKEIDLIALLQGDLTGESHFRIDFSEGLREFAIFVGRISEFNYKDIDRAALKHLFIPLNLRTEPDWDKFRELFPIPNINSMEAHYAFGLYDYALGFSVMAAGQEGKDHFETALGLLSLYETSFAVTACRVLATRMNCFKLLKRCAFPSRFAVVNLFFNDPKTRFNLGKEINRFNPTSQEYGVYIDDFTETFLDALNAYYVDDYEILIELLEQLEGLIVAQDRNNRDKLLLLQARTAIKKSDEEKARGFYQMLRYHPDFEDEAKEILQ